MKREILEVEVEMSSEPCSGGAEAVGATVTNIQPSSTPTGIGAWLFNPLKKLKPNRIGAGKEDRDRDKEAGLMV